MTSVAFLQLTMRKKFTKVVDVYIERHRDTQTFSCHLRQVKFLFFAFCLLTSISLSYRTLFICEISIKNHFNIFLVIRCKKKTASIINYLLVYGLLLKVTINNLLLMLIFACTQFYTLHQLLSKCPEAF